ncbi:NAD(P)-dependent oxidoreductase [Glutamicibacter sp. JL.03c]|uniref:NAD(P)-dependent oxidoreductase n=1 Tax=Glutamicibacter sp. JL.03c TaxID=2984842 RepID=UPI0021F6EF5A|nr:NAD(P)-dependent oxidoreductase [Glutamicibacter sp. JL.03c]UYQ78873.1 NAD(P)-dependent oxidoreductase [Glutamicibacter sp. JL.03c]
MSSIGFIGLGNMGAPMCHRLINAGHDVTVFDMNQAKVDEAVALGATAAASAADCAGNVEYLLTSLPRPDHVQSVMREAGALAALRPGSVWVDLTTNRKELVADLAAEAGPGVGVVDSPVTGAVDGARNGRLTLFMGGDDELQDRVEPILEKLGIVIRCGGLGSGNVVKLVTNQLWFVASAAIGEGFALGMSHGVKLEVLWSAIRQSVGDSFVAQHDAPSIFAGHYDPSFTLDLCNKDLGLIRELQKDVGTGLPMTDAARGTFERAAERYGSSEPELFVAKYLEDESGLSFRLDGDWVPPWEVTDQSKAATR